MYSSDTWTLRKLDQKYLENIKMWHWRRMEKIKWTKKVTNKVLEGIGEKRMLLNNILCKRSQLDWTYSKKKLPSS